MFNTAETGLANSTSELRQQLLREYELWTRFKHKTTGRIMLLGDQTSSELIKPRREMDIRVTPPDHEEEVWTLRGVLSKLNVMNYPLGTLYACPERGVLLLPLFGLPARGEVIPNMRIVMPIGPEDIPTTITFRKDGKAFDQSGRIDPHYFRLYSGRGGQTPFKPITLQIAGIYVATADETIFDKSRRYDQNRCLGVFDTTWFDIAGRSQKDEDWIPSPIDAKGVLVF